MIHDGSNDGSLKIIQEFVQNNVRCRLINNNNNGVSLARNAGMDVAKGKFIIFVDADDFIDPEMVSKMYNSIIDNDTQICICNAFRFDKDKGHLQSLTKSNVIKIKNQSNYIIKYLFGAEHRYCIWNRMFNLEFLRRNQITFSDINKIYPEDMLFNLKVSSKLQSISWLDEPLYFHIKRENSITNSYRKNIIRRYINMSQEYKGFLIRNNIFDDFKNSYKVVTNFIILDGIISAIRDNKESVSDISLQLNEMFKKYKLNEIYNNSYYYRKSSFNYILSKLLLLKLYKTYILIVKILMKHKKVDKLFFASIDKHKIL